MLHSVRIPLGWLDEKDALGIHRDAGSTQVVDVVAHKERWNRARDIVRSRTPYNHQFVTEPLPARLRDLEDRFRLRTEVQQQLAEQDWTLRLIDLPAVLGFQKMIHWESLDERLASNTPDDLEGLFSVTLPEQQDDELTIIPDSTKTATVVASLNRNLCSTSHGTADMVWQTPGRPSKKVKLFGFGVAIRPSFVQVVEYRGRLFLRDGYHRTAGLLKRGIHRVPAVVVRAKSFLQVCVNSSGFLPEELVMGERPLQLQDFHDDDVSITVLQRAHRKIVRITAEEYTVDV